MNEKTRRKKVRDAAEEVCWGLLISLHLGLNDDEIIAELKKDLTVWADLVDWDRHC